MPVLSENEIWENLQKKYNVNSKFEAIREIEKSCPGVFGKAWQAALNPKMLYQYTTIQALAMILSTKKLKLNSLTNVDDKVEGLSNDIGNLKKYFFASCWTYEGRESIPMWNMYGAGMSGIRIELPENPFPIHQFDYTTTNLKINKNDYFYIPDEYVINDDYLLLPKASLLEPIIYTDDESLLKPCVINSMTDKSAQLQFGKIGKYKSKYWEFQKEVRYLTNVYPGAGVKTLDKLPVEKQSEELLNAIFEHKDIPIDAIYLDLNPEILNHIQILLGPKVNEGDRILVNLLCEKYAPNAVIKNSELTGKV
ncbi:MAG: DUF2971 domain-containing protein [Treponema sp.]|nr:DUF2971 domain-containing protein [Treponema sp.]